MSTAYEIIKGALQILGAVAYDESPNASLGQMGLRGLNALRAQWNAMGIPCYGLQTFTKTATGAVSYTMGPAGDITTRPNGIQNVTVEDGVSTYTPSQITYQEYLEMSSRTRPGPPTSFAVNETYPQSVLYLIPAPVSGTIRILAQVPFASIAAISDTMPDPDWYDIAFEYNLAVLMAPKMGVPLDQGVEDKAREALAVVIARANPQPPPLMNLDDALTRSPYRNPWTEAVGDNWWLAG